MESLGEEYVTYYWYMNLDDGEYPSSGAYAGGRSDNVHFQKMGAIEMARLVCEEIRDLSADENVSTLVPHLKPTHEVSVLSSDENYAGLITRTERYPENTPVTLKVRPEKGCELTKWSSGTLDSLTNEHMIRFTMGTKDTSYKAHFYYPPRLEILSPEDGAELELGRDIELSVYAFKVSETNPELMVYEGNTVVATMSSAPYTFTLQGVTTGEHTYIARATNIFDEEMESPPVTFTVDNGYPKITLTEPAGDAFYEADQDITLSATAYDSDGTIANVKFYLDNNVVAELSSEPYSYSLQSPGIGIYTIHASATDNNNNVTSTESVTVSIGPMTTFEENADGYCGITDDKGSIDTDHLDYTGDGFTNTDNEIDVSLNYTVNFLDEGNYRLVFRYSATTQRPGKVMINAEEVGSVPFPATATWDIWEYSSLDYACEETGNKPISIIATGSSGLPNIDNLRIISMDGTRKVEASAECLEHPDPVDPPDTVGISIERVPDDFSIYPVPAKDFLFVKSVDEQLIGNVAVYSINGTLMKTIEGNQVEMLEVPCNELNNGFYIMKISGDRSSCFRKFSVLK